MASSSSAALTQGQVSELQLAGDYSIKSEAVTPKLGESAARRLRDVISVRAVRCTVDATVLCVSFGALAEPADTTQWPLLLKNYDKLLVRSSHFTPIPTVRPDPFPARLHGYTPRRLRPRPLC